MPMTFFSHNGTLLPVSEANIPLSDIAYSYGFGVYETIRITDGITYFADQHIDRLMESARIIGLKHQFTPAFVHESLNKLADADHVETANAKLLLVGGRSEDTANLYIQMLSPLFPDRKLYRDGAHVITFESERLYPHAKTLNMLQSYIAYSQAKNNDAYDALLIDRHGLITEGTRTNVFAVRDGKLITPPEDRILLGVMRSVVLRAAAEHGIPVETEDIALSELAQYDSLFLTSTSSKVLPVKSVGEHTFNGIPRLVTELIGDVREFLESSKGVMKDAGN